MSFALRAQSLPLTTAKLRIEGVIWGSPYVELSETSAIQSSAGYTATIDYKGRGYFSGKAHSFKAVLTHNGKQLQTYEGQWTGVSTVGGSKGPVFYDASAPKTEVTVKPIAEQSEWESRRLWDAVARGIRSGNYDVASQEKSKIENEQRQRRKDEAAGGSSWQHKHFQHVDSDPDYAHLASLLHDKVTLLHDDAYIFRG